MPTGSQISSEMSAALAVDLASNVWPENQVFANHGVDPIYGANLMQQDWFKKMVDEAKREWNSISSAKDRIKLKSQVAVEMAIKDLYDLVVDQKIPAAARVAGFKELKDIAGVSAPDAGGGGSHGPVVTIHLGGAPMTVSGKVPKVLDEDDMIDVTPSIQSEGARDDFVGNAPL